MPNSNENNPSPGTGLHFLNEDEHTNQPLDPINVDEISLANNLSEFFLEDEFTENDLKNFIGEEEFNSLSVEDRRINLDKINQLNKQKELGGSLDRLKAWSQNGGDVFGGGARDDSGRNSGSGHGMKDTLAAPDYWNKDFQATFEIKIKDASKINTLKELLITDVTQPLFFIFI